MQGAISERHTQKRSNEDDEYGRYANPKFPIIIIVRLTCRWTRFGRRCGRRGRGGGSGGGINGLSSDETTDLVDAWHPPLAEDILKLTSCRFKAACRLGRKRQKARSQRLPNARVTAEYSGLVCVLDT